MFLLKNVGLLIRKTTEDGRTKLMGIDEVSHCLNYPNKRQYFFLIQKKHSYLTNNKVFLPFKSSLRLSWVKTVVVRCDFAYE